MGIVIRQSIKSTAVNYVGAFIGFLTTMFISTRFLTAEEIGLTRILLEAALLVASFSQMGTLQSTVKFFPYFKSKVPGDKHHNGFFFYIFLLPLFGCLVFFSLYLFFKQGISAYFSANSELFLDYYYYIPPLAFFIIYQGVFEVYSSVLMRIVVPRIVREVVVRILTLLAILLYAFEIVNLNGFVFLYIVIYGLAALLNLFYVSRIGSISLKHDFSYITPSLKKEYSSYTLYFVFAALGSLLVSKVDVFMLSSKEGLNATGIYSIAFFMAAIIEMPARSILAITQPLVAEAYKNGDMSKVGKMYKETSLNQFLVGGFIFVLLWINVNNIFDIMPNGDVYREGIWVVFFISLIRVSFQISCFSSSLLMISKYYKYTLLFVFVLAALTILTNNWLIPLYGITGAALASFVSMCLHDICLIILVRYKLKIHPFSKNQWKVLSFLLAMLGINYLLPEFSQAIPDSLFRSGIILLISVPVVYFWKISSEVNTLVDGFLARIKRKS